MKIGNILMVVLGACCGAALPRLAHAQDGGAAAPASASPATEPGHASGFMVQGRLQSQGGLLSLGGGPGFLLGYQGPSFALGLGLAFNRIGVSANAEDVSGSLTLFEIMPTALVDVWRSQDGRARANLIGGVGYGKASLSGTSSSQDCVFDQFGNETCTTSQQDASVGATLIPLMIGFGGDYFLSRNFALGAEAGLQAALVTGVTADSGGTSRSIDASGNMQFGYGVLRATLVLGD